MIDVIRPYRVILDRSALHGDKFDALVDSPLLSLVRSNVVQVFLTGIFLEETLRLLAYDSNRFDKQWQFLTAVSGKRWFRLGTEVIHEEFKPDRGGAYYFHSPEEIERIVANARSVADDSDRAKIIDEALAIRKAQQERDQGFRATRIELRSDKDWKREDFEEFFETNAETHLRGAFENNADENLKRWQTDRSQYLFTTSVARALLSVVFLPVIDHNLKVDANDKSDAHQLAYLAFADIFVSDDKWFMKSCFDLIFADTSKRFMTSTEFLAWLTDISSQH
jgi:hypothetical protein